MCECEQDEYAARLQADADAAYLEHAREEAAGQEREAVIQWLCAEAEACRKDGDYKYAAYTDSLAGSIRDGEHRKEPAHG